MPDPADKSPIDTASPFRRSAWKDAEHDVRLLRTGAFRAIFRGVYVDAAIPDSPLLRAKAALCLFDEKAWASHASAARVYGLPLPALPEEHVTVMRRGQRGGHQGIRVHLAKAGLVRTVEGVRLSDHAQLFLELAGQLHLVDLVVVGDAMVKRRLITVAALVSACADSRARHARAARLAASYVRERVDSPMETRLRMLIVLAGLPEPMVNVTVEDEFGLPVRRYDLSWPELKLIVEYDGRHHVEVIEQWEKDLDRREGIDDDGWRILVVIASGIYKHPEQTVERVFKALKARGAKGLPQRPSDAWRPHFPSRT